MRHHDGADPPEEKREADDQEYVLRCSLPSDSIDVARHPCRWPPFLSILGIVVIVVIVLGVTDALAVLGAARP